MASESKLLRENTVQGQAFSGPRQALEQHHKEGGESRRAAGGRREPGQPPDWGVTGCFPIEDDHWFPVWVSLDTGGLWPGWAGHGWRGGGVPGSLPLGCPGGCESLRA